MINGRNIKYSESVKQQNSKLKLLQQETSEHKTKSKLSKHEHKSKVIESRSRIDEHNRARSQIGEHEAISNWAWRR